MTGCRFPPERQHSPSRRYVVFRWLGIAALTAQLAGGESRAWASDGSSERTAYLLTRAIGYAASLREHANIQVGIAVLFKKGDPVSEHAAANLGAALESLAGTTVQGLTLRSRLVPFANATELRSSVGDNGINVFYLCEGLESYLDAIVKLSWELKVLTVSGNEAMVRQGVALGILLFAGSKGTLVVNLRIARAEGANFGSDLLRVARVIR